MEEAMPYLEKLSFTPEKVVGNTMFSESKLIMTIEMAHLAFKEENKKV